MSRQPNSSTAAQGAVGQSEGDEAPAGNESLGVYTEITNLIERMHRRFHDVVKSELDRMGHEDVNAGQALLIHQIGDQELSAKDLTARGYYLGSNATYNLKKLVEAGCVSQKPSRQDRRATRIKLTKRGQDVRDAVDDIFVRHSWDVAAAGEISADQMKVTAETLSMIERFWNARLAYRPF